MTCVQSKNFFNNLGRQSVLLPLKLHCIQTLKMDFSVANFYNKSRVRVIWSPMDALGICIMVFNVSPSLDWSNAPISTKFVAIMFPTFFEIY